MNESDKPHPLVSLARKAITLHLSGGSTPEPDVLDNPGEPAGAFVSLKKAGKL